MKTVPAKNLMCTIAANVNNPLLTDEQFREFVRNSAGICQEVLEWREAMAQLGKDYSKHQICPEVEPPPLSQGEIDKISAMDEELKSKTQRGRVTGVVSGELPEECTKVQLSSAYGEFGTPLTPERKTEQMNKFLSEGDKVMIDEDNRQWGESPVNPKGVVGTVAVVDDWITVAWNNGEENTYRANHNDLMRVDR